MLQYYSLSFQRIVCSPLFLVISLIICWQLFLFLWWLHSLFYPTLSSHTSISTFSSVSLPHSDLSLHLKKEIIYLGKHCFVSRYNTTQSWLKLLWHFLVRAFNLTSRGWGVRSRVIQPPWQSSCRHDIPGDRLYLCRYIIIDVCH